jgi:predicted MFS family arabinose efflux permease/acylphosphatase
MVIGTAIKYWAISTHMLDEQIWHVIIWDIKAQVFMAAIGFAIFGVGIEIAGITVSKVIVKWFKGKEMALAMGLQMAVARLGTALALATSVPVAKAFNTVAAPVLICLILLCIGLIAYFIYTFMDKRLDASVAAAEKASNSETKEEAFHLSDILKIVTNKGWWYIAILCVLFYSAVFPFLKYATDLMVQKFHINEDWAGIIPAMLPFGTILLTPLFGNMYDRKGKGASIMIVGAVLLIIVHLIFTLPFVNNWVVAILLILVLGVGFSLVPSAMWPSVPKIIPENQLGTAYALVFWVQNWGLMGVPALIGWVLNKYCFLGYFAVIGTGFVTTQGDKITSVVGSDNKTYVISEAGTISRKDKDVKVTGFIKNQDGSVSAVLTAANDTIGTEFITNKSLGKAIKKNEIKVTRYTYEDKAPIETFITDKGGKVSKYNNVFSFYDYTLPMMIFLGLGLLALLFGFLLKAEDRKKGYGLEMPNIKNDK